MRWALIVALAACKPQAPPPAAPVAVALPPTPLPPACVTPPDEATPITHASGDATHVQYCLADQCFALTLGSGKLERLASPPVEPTDAAVAHVEAQSPELKVCSSAGCKALTPAVMPGANPLHAATNADGTYFVVLLGDAEAGKGYAEVWDVAKAKKAATFRYARGDFKCGEVAMVGSSIYVGTSECTSPSARAALYSVKGTKIANVGGKDFGVYGNAKVQVEGNLWAFLEENGNHVALQDVVKGKVTKMLDLTSLWHEDAVSKGEAMGNPGESTIVRIADNRIAVVAGSPANGSVAVIDLATGELAITRAPLCH